MHYTQSNQYSIFWRIKLWFFKDINFFLLLLHDISVYFDIYQSLRHHTVIPDVLVSELLCTVLLTYILTENDSVSTRPNWEMSIYHNLLLLSNVGEFARLYQFVAPFFRCTSWSNRDCCEVRGEINNTTFTKILAALSEEFDGIDPFIPHWIRLKKKW